jgi:hypothetical protein
MNSLTINKHFIHMQLFTVNDYLFIMARSKEYGYKLNE